MSRIAIITDSNSGITIKEAQEKGIFLVPMPFIIAGEEYFEEISLSQNDFYDLLKSKVDISTSQPSSYSLESLWDEILENYDEIIYIPMSSGLSASCQNASSLAENEKYKNKVFVINNQRISVTQKASVYEALYLVNSGMVAKEIASYLLKTKSYSSIYIMVDTLEYLKKGGRVTPAAAALGTLLNIKPILQIHGDKLDSYCKVLSTRVARIKMIQAIKKDLETRFNDLVEESKIMLGIAHTNNLKEAIEFKKQVEEQIPNIPVVFIDSLSLSVSCHIGSGSLALACMPNINKYLK